MSVLSEECNDQFFEGYVRLITYKVVKDAKDALNVFVEMVSIKLALQSLKKSRKNRIVFEHLNFMIKSCERNFK